MVASRAQRRALRVVGPPTRRRAPWSLRPTLVVVVALVLGSLLMVAGAQAYLTQEQVRLTTIQTQLTAQVAEHHDLEYRVAQLSNPAHIVGAAQRQGLTVPSQVTDLTPVTVPPTTHLASTIKTTSSAKTAPLPDEDHHSDASRLSCPGVRSRWPVSVRHSRPPSLDRRGGRRQRRRRARRAAARPVVRAVDRGRRETRPQRPRRPAPRRGFERRPAVVLSPGPTGTKKQLRAKKRLRSKEMPRPKNGAGRKRLTGPRHGARPTTAVTGAVARRRLGVIRVTVILVFMIIAGRLVIVQVFSGGRYAAIGVNEVTSTVVVPANRGGIFDRNGAVLATSVPRTTIVGDPELIHHPGAEAAALAPVLGVPAGTLTKDLKEHTGFVYLAHKVGTAEADAVGKLNLVGINLLPDSQRVDPGGQLAAPVLGQVGAEGTGLSGLEYQYNNLLGGENGTETIEQSPSGVTLPGGTTQLTSSKPGTGIELTLDEPLQYVAEQALGTEIKASHAKSGTAIVMNTHTGDILAMANLAAAGGTVVQAPSNLALTNVYEPGSVFKLVTFSAALQDGIITPGQVFTVPNSLTIDNGCSTTPRATPRNSCRPPRSWPSRRTSGPSRSPSCWARTAWPADPRPRVSVSRRGSTTPTNRTALVKREPEHPVGGGHRGDSDRPGRRRHPPAGPRHGEHGGHRGCVRPAPARPGHGG